MWLAVPGIWFNSLRMKTQTDAQIFLADSRGLSRTDFFQSYHTFNFGSYVAEGREPFGSLGLLNNDTLRPGASLSMQVETNTEVVLIPVVGGLEYQIDGQTDFLEAGQAGRFSLTAGKSYAVVNPYEQETINVLQLWLTSSTPAFTPGIAQLSFDLATKNKLLPLFNTAEHQGFIGRFDGRAEDTYLLRNSANGVFVVVLQGAFEVANRLLQANDGLALRNLTEVELEALSNDAVLVLIEVTSEDDKSRLNNTG